MMKVTSVKYQVNQEGIIYLVYRSSEKRAHGARLNDYEDVDDEASKFDVNAFPPLVPTIVTKAKAARLRQKRRRQRWRESKRQDEPGSSQPGRRTPHDIPKTPLVAKAWPGDLEFYKAIAGGSSIYSSWVKKPRPIPRFSTLEALKSSIADKKQECKFLEQQRGLICSEIRRIREALTLPIIYIEGFTPFGLGTLVKGKSNVESLLRMSENELASLRLQLKDWQEGRKTGEAEFVTAMQALLQLKHRRDRMIPQTPLWKEVHSSIRIIATKLGVSEEEIEVAMDRLCAKESNELEVILGYWSHLRTTGRV